MRALSEGEPAADILSELTAQDTPAEHPVPRRVTIMVTLMAVLFVVVPALFWHDTWFGRPLDNEEIAEYLADRDKPRKAQHALAQISGRITEGDAAAKQAAKQWYPQILDLADHSLPELRLTAAWVMGQDVQEKPFRDKLHEMLDDPQPIVRRNAALSLASFNDPAGRVVLLAMLRPFAVQSTDTGVLTNRLESGDVVDRDTLLARVARQDQDEPAEVRSPVPGVVAERLLKDGANVHAGDDMVVLSPDPTHAHQSLRALYLVGTPEDIEDIRRFFRPNENLPAYVAEQARLTAERIRKRAAGGS